MKIKAKFIYISGKYYFFYILYLIIWDNLHIWPEYGEWAWWIVAVALWPELERQILGKKKSLQISIEEISL